MSAKIKAVPAETQKPLCPNCEKEITYVLYVQDGFMVNHNIYFCPHCNKVLGVGFGRS